MELNEINLNEVFDSEIAQYKAINLNKRAKVPQLWNVSVPGNDNLLVRMVSYLSKGDALKAVKQGDKFVQVFLMSLSKNGNAAELRNGLGSDPIGALNTIFDTVYEQVKKLKMDAVLFRFPAKKMKGQEKTLQRIIKRLAMQRTGGKFVVLEDLYQFTGKHAYVLIYRKNRPLEDIAGIPGIDSDLYTKVDSKVGDVYINDKTGKQVSKLEAIAGSIAAQENTRSERSVISKTKVSRRELLSAMYGVSKPEDLENYSEEGRRKYIELQDNPPIVQSDSTKIALVHKNVLNKIDESKSVFLDKINSAVSEEKSDREARFLLDSLERISGHGVEKFYYLSSEEKYKFAKPYILIINNALKTSNNAMDVYKKIAEDLETYGPDDNVGKTRALRGCISALNRNVFYTPLEELFRTETEMDLTEEERKVITDYALRGYEEMNDFLLGKDKSLKSVYENKIPVLDGAFKKGTKLEKGTILYRAQKLPYADVEKAAKNKTLYFPNYISTSLAPIIFGERNDVLDNIKPNATTVTFESETFDDVISTVMTPKNIGVAVNGKKATKKTDINISMGITIKGAHKVNVIIPGNMSKYSSECEVILPRGLALKIHSIHGYENARDIEFNRPILVETSVVDPELLDESELIDGNKFLSEGKIEKIGFKEFLKENTDKISQKGLELLSTAVDLTFVPEKFII